MRRPARPNPTPATAARRVGAVARAVRPVVEQLEPRRLLAADLPTPGSFDAGGLFAGGDSDLAYDADGTLHLAFYDAAAENLKYASRPDGGDWSDPLVLDGGKQAGLYADVATQGKKIAVSYFDSGPADLKVSLFDGKGWETRTLDTGSAGSEVTGMYTSAAFGNGGELFVSYYDMAAGDLRLAELRPDGGLDLQTLDSAGDVGRHTSLAVDPDTGGWLVAYESTSGGEVRLAEQVVPTREQKRDIRLGRIEPLPAFTVTKVDDTGGGAAFTSLALGPGNEPAVAFRRADGDVRFDARNGTGWVYQTVLPGQMKGVDTTLWYDADDETGGGWKLLSYNLDQGVVQLAEYGPDWQLSNVLYDANGATGGASLAAAPTADGGSVAVSYAPVVAASGNAASILSVVDRIDGDAAVNLTAWERGGHYVRIEWKDQSVDNAGYRVEVSADGGRTWEQRAVAGPEDTALSVRGLDVNTEYAFRLNTLYGDSPAGSGATSAFAFSTTATDPTGFYRVSGLTMPLRGSAAWNTKGDGGLHGDEDAETYNEWIQADGWQDAVRKAITGTTEVGVTFKTEHLNVGDTVYHDFEDTDDSFRIGTAESIQAIVDEWVDKNGNGKFDRARDPDFDGVFVGGTAEEEDEEVIDLSPNPRRPIIALEDSFYDKPPANDQGDVVPTYEVDGDYNDFWWDLKVEAKPNLVIQNLPEEFEADGPPHEEDPGGFVGLNDDDDDKNDESDLSQNGPATGENDLVPISLNVPSVPFGYADVVKVTLKATSGGDKIKVWNTPNKQQLVLGDDLSEMVWYPSASGALAVPSTLYVEGVAESEAAGDISLQLVYETQAGGSPGQSSTTKDVANITNVKVDLDVDSDNKPGPRDEVEDRLEDDATTGKVVLVTDGDFDNDGVKDTEDYDGIKYSQGTATIGLEFVPLYLKIPPQLEADPDNISIKLKYDKTKIRIWTKDASDTRVVADDVVEDDASYTARKLKARAGSLLKLYVEGLAPSATTIPITAVVSITVGGKKTDLPEDKVHVAPTKLDLVLKKVADNAPAGDLPEADEIKVGAWVPFNVDDDDYSATGSGTNDGKDNGQPGQVVDENDLLPVVVKKIQGAVKNGTIKLEIPDGLRVYKKDDRTDRVRDTDSLPADENTTLYVEGQTIGTNVLRLEYKLNGQVLKGGDEAKANVFKWEGPLNVPEHGTFRYTAQENSLPDGASWIEADGGLLQAGGAALSKEVKWDADAHIGKARLKVNDNYTWGLDVNVVGIKVEVPDQGQPFTAGKVFDGGLWNQTNLQVNSKLVKTGQPQALSWKAKVTFVGPGDNKDRGLRHMRAGFVQNLTPTVYRGDYGNDPTLVASIEGKKYWDTKDNFKEKFYSNSNNAFFENASDQKRFDTIEESDSPEAGPPIVNSNGTALTGVSLVWNLDLYVVALTKDTRNNANTTYVGQALAAWQFNGNGAVAGGNWVGNGAGITPPTAWDELSDGREPKTDEPRFNPELRNKTTWNPPYSKHLIT